MARGEGFTYFSVSIYIPRILKRRKGNLSSQDKLKRAAKAADHKLAGSAQARESTPSPWTKRAEWLSQGVKYNNAWALTALAWGINNQNEFNYDDPTVVVIVVIVRHQR